MSTKQVANYSLIFVLGYCLAGVGVTVILLLLVALVLVGVAYYSELRKIWNEIRGSNANNGNPSGKDK